MKKITSMMLIVAFVVSLLAACAERQKQWGF